MRRVALALLLLLCATPVHAQDGAALYSQFCAGCHDRGLMRTPTRRMLTGLEPERIVAALENGTMRLQGTDRTAVERRAIAAFLTGRAVGDVPAPPPLRMCTARAPRASGLSQWKGWGTTAMNDRFQRTAGFTPADVP